MATVAAYLAGCIDIDDGAAPWSDADRADGAPDGASATSELAAMSTNRIRADTYGLGLSLPAGGTYNGLTVVLRLGASLATDAMLLHAQLIDNGDSPIGDEKSVAVVNSALANYTLGGPADTWGVSAAALVNARIEFFITTLLSLPTYILDAGTMTLTYTPGAWRSGRLSRTSRPAFGVR